MSKKIYITAHSVFTPLGLGTGSNWGKMAKGETAIRKVNREDITLKDFYAASFDTNQWEQETRSLNQDLTRLEKAIITAVQDVAYQCPISLDSSRCIFVFSTTKGNIDLLAYQPKHPGLGLPAMGKVVSRFFGNPTTPLVISNACISGLSALLAAKALLEQGIYDQAIVCGGDMLSEFTVAGFNCLQAISPFPCKPFDKNRFGLSPGEGSAVVVLSNQKPKTNLPIFIAAGATSNDANHISGPSRTGEGLHIAIEKAFALATLQKEHIDYVSAHGTATLYNDESESIALSRSGLNHILTNSLKGYTGHTFGAAGLIEVAIAAESMSKTALLPSLGYDEHGVSAEMNILRETTQKKISHCLKTASGFGGCNAALILSHD